MDYSSNPSDNMHPTTGKHTAGDPAAGIPATIDNPEHMNTVYDELLDLITGAGLTPNEGVLTQVREAVNALIAAAALELATQVEMDAGVVTDKVPAVNVVATYVAAQVAALVDASPVALDTLKELAAALGNDENFSTTMTNALALKLDASAYTAADILSKLSTEIISAVGLAITGDISVSGTVNGRDVAVDGAKLDAGDFGVGNDGQTWQDLKASRSLNVTYTNTSGKAIMVIVKTVSSTSVTNMRLIINGVIMMYPTNGSRTYTKGFFVMGIIPDGDTYQVGSSGVIDEWRELRV